MRIFNLFLLTVVLLLNATFVFSQNSSGVNMPSVSMPSSPTSPSMPSLSVPSLDSKFYIPQTVVSNKKDVVPNPKHENNQESQASSVASVAALNPMPTLDTSTENALYSMDSGFVSASDISSLGHNGLLGSLYGLTGGASRLSSASNDTMLLKIMQGLSEIKKQQDELSEKVLANENTMKNQETYNKAEKSNNPAILRFVINGYNISDTCKTVYFSEKENDGSFLLTADRRYLFEDKPRNETFYFLFRSNGIGGASRAYNIEPAIVQDYKNEDSMVYKFCQQNDLKADKIGNLVTLHTASADLNCDLLLDIGE